MGFPKWDAATHCTGGPSQGTLALTRWILENYGDDGAYSLGIYNCRTVRGGSTTSMHSEGRAVDMGFPVNDPDGNRLLGELLSAPGRLGIQAIIYERTIYSALSPAGRYYGGVNPHSDHLHIENTREAAERLTYATVSSVLDKGLPRHFRGTRVLFEGREGTDVKWLQRKLKMKNLDGIFGPNTARAVKAFEEDMADDYPRLVIDGRVGPVTWKALGVTPKLKAA